MPSFPKTVSQQTAWQISNNVWVGPTKVPVNCTDTSVVTSIAVGNYSLIDFTGNVAVTAPYDTAFLVVHYTYYPIAIISIYSM